ncbi:uncharacterized protein F5Z01DRAFT_26540 [Emericellopsis atlantica]|uniref:Uncharacterized protein n=1 Tax=Emericellopsis atlantica TaxID=2614577 RepID=A0A9P7ZWZ5_9HYPO|nr:uncharacterized protein F5Z01DRAFT_26540 [Emericellopsis atlantica]KAG9259147.1 hypothetical protein F5Z01DRAFT_26540 [Emericellopsis atlantica]
MPTTMSLSTSSMAACKPSKVTKKSYQSTPARQTRRRAKLPGSSPLMTGLDWRGKAQENLPTDAQPVAHTAGPKVGDETLEQKKPSHAAASAALPAVTDQKTDQIVQTQDCIATADEETRAGCPTITKPASTTMDRQLAEHIDNHPVRRALKRRASDKCDGDSDGDQQGQVAQPAIGAASGIPGLGLLPSNHDIKADGGPVVHANNAMVATATADEPLPESDDEKSDTNESLSSHSPHSSTSGSSWNLSDGGNSSTRGQLSFPHGRPGPSVLKRRRCEDECEAECSGPSKRVRWTQYNISDDGWCEPYNDTDQVMLSDMEEETLSEEESSYCGPFTLELALPTPASVDDDAGHVMEQRHWPAYGPCLDVPQEEYDPCQAPGKTEPYDPEGHPLEEEYDPVVAYLGMDATLSECSSLLEDCVAYDEKIDPEELGKSLASAMNIDEAASPLSDGAGWTKNWLEKVAPFVKKSSKVADSRNDEGRPLGGLVLPSQPDACWDCCRESDAGESMDEGEDMPDWEEEEEYEY